MEEDLTYFSKEDLFPSDGTRPPEERVNPIFRRIYSLSPLEILIKKDEKKELQSRGAQLQYLCKQHLTLLEYNFLIEQLGRNFGVELRMPLEFRNFAHEDFAEYFQENLKKFRKRLGIIMRVASLDGYRGKVNAHMLTIPYLFASEERIIEIYDNVLNQRRKYPKNFFHPENRRIPGILIRHLIDNILKIPHEKVLPNVSKKEFEKYKLKPVLDIYYPGNISPVYRAICDAYPQGEFPDIHIPDYRPDDPVKALLDLLEAN